MYKLPRYRLTASNASEVTLSLPLVLNNHAIKNPSTSNGLLPLILLFFLMLSGLNCFAESGYKEMGDAFEFFDKLDAEESAIKSAKKLEQTKKDVKTTEKSRPAKSKPAIEGLDSILSEITETPSTKKIKPPKKETVKALSKIIKTAKKPAAPVKKNNFRKRDIAGNKLKTEAEQWACVEDAVNKLVWEVKTSNGEKQDKNNTYTWHNPEQNNISGTANGGRCKGGVPCDTHAYVQAINEQKLCGYSDWRLPTRKEMLSLVGQKASKDGATIDNKYFPDAMPSWYWTASDNEEHPEYAWYVLFRNGISLNDLKERPKHIRLVRGGEHKFATAD